jgi:hypothetical protein
MKEKINKPLWTIRVKVLCSDCNLPSYITKGLFEDEATALEYIKIVPIPDEQMPLPIQNVTITLPFKDSLRTWLQVIDMKTIKRNKHKIVTYQDLPKTETEH